jgi:predicted O-methyltransferase YrrM
LDTDPKIYPAVLPRLIRLLRRGGIVVTENLWEPDIATKRVGRAGARAILKTMEMLLRTRHLHTAVTADLLAISLRL